MGSTELPLVAGDERPVLCGAAGAAGADSPRPDSFRTEFQNIKVSANLGREQLYELGRRGPYHRYVNYPVEVTAEVKVFSAATGCL